MKQTERKRPDTVRVCRRCGTVVRKSQVQGYKFYCPEHDEDLFSFETEEITVAENTAYDFWRIARHNDWLVEHGYDPDYEQTELFNRLKRKLKVGIRELRKVTDKVYECKDFDEFYQKLMALKVEEM